MNATEVIERFGGHLKLAQRLGVEPIVAYTWRRRDRIPAHWINRVAEEARKAGIDGVTAETLAAQIARSFGPKTNKTRRRARAG